MSIILKKGREKSLLRRHLWIFSGAIQHADENIAPGSTVDLLSSNKQFLAKAAYSPASQIRARVWTFEDEVIDKEFFRKRIRQAIAVRSAISPSPLTPLPHGEGNALRLIYAESDNIPGLIVDKYNDVLVMQCLTAGAEYWKETFADLLLEETGCTTIKERYD
jgi:23S rRNA (cytosine1962-C5)-methyltransferase